MAQLASFSYIPSDISDFPTWNNYGLALRQKHFEPILAGRHRLSHPGLPDALTTWFGPPTAT